MSFFIESIWISLGWIFPMAAAFWVLFIVSIFAIDLRKSPICLFFMAMAAVLTTIGIPEYFARVDYAAGHIYDYHKAQSLPETECPGFVEDAASCFQKHNIVVAFRKSKNACLDVYLTDGDKGLKAFEKESCSIHVPYEGKWFINPEPKNVVTNKILTILFELRDQGLKTSRDLADLKEAEFEKAKELRTIEAAKMLEAVKN